MGRWSNLAFLAACSGGGEGPSKDAAVDVAPCTNTVCGGTCCPSPAHVCSTAGTGCECPTQLVPQPFSTLLEMMDTTSVAPDVVGIGIIDGTDSNLHALVVGFHPTDTAIDTDYTLPPAGTAPFVALGYDVDVVAQTTRSTYYVSQGTLRLSRRCTKGVAGAMTGVSLREQTSVDDSTPHPQGCSLAVPDLSFDFGGACP